MTPSRTARLPARLVSLVASVALLGLALAPACRTTHGPRGMENVEWTLVEILGEPVVVPADAAAPSLVFDSAALMITGNTGVNRFNGSYQVDGSSVQIGTLVSTRRAGPPELMELETLYMQALERTREAAVTGGALELRSGDTVLARLTRTGSG